MYNKVFIIGNLVRDPELRSTTAGIPVAHFAVAVNRIGKEAGVDFLNVVAWRRLAEICAEYLKKGRPVAIEGRFQVRSYQGKDGKQRTYYEIVADNMQMLGKKETAANRPEKNSSDEIPF